MEALLRRIHRPEALTARVVYGFWPANTIGDDLVLYKDGTRAGPGPVGAPAVLRQQEVIADRRLKPNLGNTVVSNGSTSRDAIHAPGFRSRRKNTQPAISPRCDLCLSEEIIGHRLSQAPCDRDRTAALVRHVIRSTEEGVCSGPPDFVLSMRLTNRNTLVPCN